MTLGIDYSFARPSMALIQAKNYKFVCRYLSHEPTKNITLSEAQALRHRNLEIVLVWEDAANAALKGKAQGIADAKVALAQANAIGFPKSNPIYFAVDFDASSDQQGAINEYMQGVCDVIGLARTGVYGGFYVIERVAIAHLAHYFWQTLAWSGGQISGHAHIYQNGKSDFAGGADIDEARQTDFGQWGFSAPTPPPTPPPVPPPAQPLPGLTNNVPPTVSPPTQTTLKPPTSTGPSLKPATSASSLPIATSISSWWAKLVKWVKDLL